MLKKYSGMDMIYFKLNIHRKYILIGKVKAMRYAYTGDLETEIWYDDKKRWVGMEFVGSDGSHIKYLCKKCSSASREK